ncbi:HlyU family transcriptional regulator [Xinfangfangia sp. CPCC 101601]|uniref:HlyU family transcriptional regulator n=1 Tax=Pseudogemmobacter lacusdianii TaxID=3069608 RepID=A0ABU0VVF5_9RHOB|nr:HlyU family transcriptional regulator [Xinfangfangia sp. CPCC 101601]MDQ2065735.1 HlyU family transcriptional regulator [Xinfangfangia sp. CPCC 101601]
MSLFSWLFGSKSSAASAPATAAETYKDFSITPNPIKEGGHFRVAAKIEKDGKTHELIRADTMASLNQAVAISQSKAKQLIDEQGDRLFG